MPLIRVVVSDALAQIVLLVFFQRQSFLLPSFFPYRLLSSGMDITGRYVVKRFVRRGVIGRDRVILAQQCASTTAFLPSFGKQSPASHGAISISAEGLSSQGWPRKTKRGCSDGFFDGFSGRLRNSSGMWARMGSYPAVADTERCSSPAAAKLLPRLDNLLSAL